MLIGAVLAVVVVASIVLVAKYDPGVFSANAPAATAPPPANNSSFTVHILSVSYQISNCFANTSTPGATTSGGSTLTLQIALENSGVHTCVVNAVSVVTNGFAVTHSNTPLSIPPSQKGTLQYTLHTPNFNVNQPIGVDLTVTVLG